MLLLISLPFPIMFPFRFVPERFEASGARLLKVGACRRREASKKPRWRMKFDIWPGVFRTLKWRKKGKQKEYLRVGEFLEV